MRQTPLFSTVHSTQVTLSPPGPLPSTPLQGSNLAQSSFWLTVSCSLLQRFVLSPSCLGQEGQPALGDQGQLTGPPDKPVGSDWRNTAQAGLPAGELAVSCSSLRGRLSAPGFAGQVRKALCAQRRFGKGLPSGLSFQFGDTQATCVSDF